MTKQYVFPTDFVAAVNKDYSKVKSFENDLSQLYADLKLEFVHDIVDDFIESQTKTGIIVTNGRLYVNIRSKVETATPVWVKFAESSVREDEDPIDDALLAAKGLLVEASPPTWCGEDVVTTSWNGLLAQTFLIVTDMSSEALAELLQGTITAWKPAK